MTPIDYHCKMCGKPSVAYYDPSCPIRDLENWRRCICCTRCYTFRDAYGSVKRSIERVCVSLASMRQTVRDKEVVEAAEKKIRERLMFLTKKLASLCSDYYQVQNIWEMEMVLILMERPEGCNRAVNSFRNGYEKDLRQKPTRQEHQQEHQPMQETELIA